jgi:general secretion pathway protein I
MRPRSGSAQAAHHNQAGFTLLEVLVAFVIAALAFGALFRSIASGLQNVSVSGDYAQALSRARSHLAAVGHGLAIAPTAQNGDDGSGFRWSLRIAPAATAAAILQPADARGASPRITLYAVEVTETWRSGPSERSLRLVTERVGPPPP